MSSFKWIFIHPLLLWKCESTPGALDFSKEKRQEVKKQGDCLRIPGTIALSTIQMKAFAVLPSSPPPFLRKKWDWNNFSNPWKLHKNVSMHFHILLTFLVKLNYLILTIFCIVSSNWSATFSRLKKNLVKLTCCIFTIFTNFLVKLNAVFSRF